MGRGGRPEALVGHAGHIFQARTDDLGGPRRAAQDLAGAIARRRGKQMNEQELVIGVEGMTCGGCASRLERVLRGAEGVASAEVQLEAKKAVVKGPIRPEAVRALRDGGVL
jgi:copper chaperone CopZ